MGIKRNPPKNPFPDEVRELFMWEYRCWDCGINQNLELDHILGRKSDSPLNAYLNCRRCHTAKSHKSDAHRLQTTLKFLMRSGYDLTEKDVEFYKKHEEYYKKIN